jgi:hypothetical protein
MANHKDLQMSSSGGQIIGIAPRRQGDMGNSPKVFLRTVECEQRAEAVLPAQSSFSVELESTQSFRQPTGDVLQHLVPYVRREDPPKTDQGHLTRVERQYARRIERLYALWVIAGFATDLLIDIGFLGG